MNFSIRSRRWDARLGSAAGAEPTSAAKPRNAANVSTQPRVRTASTRYAVWWSLPGSRALVACAAAGENVGAGPAGCGVLCLPVVLLRRVGPVGDAQRRPGDEQQQRGDKRQPVSERGRQLTSGCGRQVD